MFSIIRRALQDRSATDPRIGVLLCAFLAVLLAMPASAEVRAHLDRSKVYIGDPVTLVIESTGTSSGEPDLSPLNKDFRVLGTGTSTQFSFSNGRSSNRTSWTIQLGPLQAGKLLIPPVQVGTEQTKALELEVTETPEQPDAQQSKHLFLEAEVDAAGNAYVLQQIPYTLRLYHDETLVNGDLRPPQLRDALIRQLGDDKRYTVTRNNRRYQVVERRYAVSPEKSGELRIPPASFSGQINTSQQPSAGPSRRDTMMQQLLRNGPFGGGGRAVRVFSKAITIDVLPRPTGVGSDWLPAENIELHDSWASEPPQFAAGEPVTRTISLRATGLSGTQIPALQLAQPQHTRVYPESPVNESRTDGDKVYAISRQTFTYIPGQAGELTIPAIELPWWNIRSDEQAIARLPEWVLRVEPGVAGASLESNGQTQQQDGKSVTTSRPTSPESQLPGKSWLTTLKAFPWFWVVLVLSVLTAAMLARRWLGDLTRGGEGGRPETPAPAVARLSGIEEIMPRLQNACEANDAKEAAQLLLELGRTHWQDDPPRSLGQLALRLGYGQDQIKALDRVLYSADPSDWNGAALWACSRDAWKKEPVSRPASDEFLEPLYPKNG